MKVEADFQFHVFFYKHNINIQFIKHKKVYSMFTDDLKTMCTVIRSDF